MSEKKYVDISAEYLRSLETLRAQKLIKRGRDLKIEAVLLVVSSIFVTIVALSSTKLPTQLIEGTHRYTSYNSESVKIENLEKELSGIKKVISDVKEYPNPSSLEIARLESEISSLREENKLIKETILANAETAITPKVLRIEQQNLKDRVTDLNSQVQSIYNIILGTLFAALLAGAGYFIKKILDGKNTATP